MGAGLLLVGESLNLSGLTAPICNAAMRREFSALRQLGFPCECINPVVQIPWPKSRGPWVFREQAARERPMSVTMSDQSVASPVPNWRTPLVIIVCGCAIALLSFGPRSTLGFFIQPM